MDKQKIREQIEALEKQIAELKAELDKPDYAYIPGPFTPWQTWPPKPVSDKCSKCAIQLTGCMMYNCPVTGCPAGLNSTAGRSW